MLASRHVGDLGISIAADWRGVGLGRALLNAIIDEARSTLDGLRMVRLDVFEGNEPAIALYRSVGFIETGRTPGAVLRRGEYVDSIQMVLELRVGVKRNDGASNSGGSSGVSENEFSVAPVSTQSVETKASQ